MGAWSLFWAMGIYNYCLMVTGIIIFVALLHEKYSPFTGGRYSAYGRHTVPIIANAIYLLGLRAVKGLT